MTEAEKAYQYFVIAVPESEEQAKAYFWARKALQSTLTQPNEPLTLDELRESPHGKIKREDVERFKEKWLTVIGEDRIKEMVARELETAREELGKAIGGISRW